MSMSIGGSRQKSKTNESGTSEVQPYKPTEPYIAEIIAGAKSEFDKGNKEYLGGYDYNNLYSDPTGAMLDMENYGGDLYKNFSPDAMKDLTSTYNSFLAGNPTGAGGSYLADFMKTGNTGTSLDDFNAGRGGNAYDMMSPDGGKSYLDDFLSSTTDKISNRIGAEFAGNGRYGGGGSYSDSVGRAVTEETMPYMLDLANAERDRQFTGNTDYLTNQYNAGSELAGLGLDAGMNMNNAEINAMVNSSRFNTDLYNLANDSLTNSYGYAGMDNMRADRMNEIDMSKMMYDQDAYNMRLMDFSDMIDKYAFGLPTKISTGTSSGKSSGFGFGIG